MDAKDRLVEVGSLGDFGDQAHDSQPPDAIRHHHVKQAIVHLGLGADPKAAAKAAAVGDRGHGRRLLKWRLVVDLDRDLRDIIVNQGPHDRGEIGRHAAQKSRHLGKVKGGLCTEADIHAVHEIVRFAVFFRIQLSVRHTSDIKELCLSFADLADRRSPIEHLASNGGLRRDHFGEIVAIAERYHPERNRLLFA